MNYIITYGLSTLILLLSFSSVEKLLGSILGKKTTTIFVKMTFAVSMLITGYMIVDFILFGLYLYNTLFDHIFASILILGIQLLAFFVSFAMLINYNFMSNEVGIPKIIAFVLFGPLISSVIYITSIRQEISSNEYKNINTIYQKIQGNKKLKKLFSVQYKDFMKDKFISRREYRVFTKIGAYYAVLQKQNMKNQMQMQNEALKKNYMRDLQQNISNDK